MASVTQGEYAADVLRRLARCTKVRPFQAGDEDLVCSNDMLPLVSNRGHLEHDPAMIRRYRDLTNDGRWPNEKGN